MRSIRTGQWKYILNLHPEFAFTTHIDLPGNLGQRAYWGSWEAAAETDPEAAAIVKRYHQRPAEELYDLSSDPYEQKNLAADPRQKIYGGKNHIARGDQFSSLLVRAE